MIRRRDEAARLTSPRVLLSFVLLRCGGFRVAVDVGELWVLRVLGCEGKLRLLLLELLLVARYLRLDRARGHAIVLPALRRDLHLLLLEGLHGNLAAVLQVKVRRGVRHLRGVDFVRALGPHDCLHRLIIQNGHLLLRGVQQGRPAVLQCRVSDVPGLTTPVYGPIFAWKRGSPLAEGSLGPRTDHVLVKSVPAIALRWDPLERALQEVFLGADAAECVHAVIDTVDRLHAVEGLAVVRPLLHGRRLSLDLLTQLRRAQAHVVVDLGLPVLRLDAPVPLGVGLARLGFGTVAADVLGPDVPLVTVVGPVNEGRMVPRHLVSVVAVGLVVLDGAALAVAAVVVHA